MAGELFSYLLCVCVCLLVCDVSSVQGGHSALCLEGLRGRGHPSAGLRGSDRCGSVPVAASEACIQGVVVHERGPAGAQLEVTIVYVSAFDRQAYQKHVSLTVGAEAAAAMTSPRRVGSSQQGGRAAGGVGSSSALSSIPDRSQGVGALFDAGDNAGDNAGGGSQVPFSFFPRVGAALPDNSPLRSQITAPPTAPAFKGAAGTGASASAKLGRNTWEAPVFAKGRPVDQPVTFHTNVKSSGYGSAKSDHDIWLAKQRKLEKQRELKKKLAAKARGQGGDAGDAAGTVTQRAIGDAALARQRTHSAPKQLHGAGRVTLLDPAAAVGQEVAAAGGGAGSGSGVRIRQYPTACKLLCDHQPYNDYSPRCVAGAAAPVRPVTRVAYNGDGSLLALAYADNSFSTLKLPVAKHGGAEAALHYCGHADGSQVTSVQFSHTAGAGAMLLSAGSDGTVRVWRQGRSQAPGVIISHTHQNADPAAGAGSMAGSQSGRGRNRPLQYEVPCARFYYGDRFVTLAHRGVLRMYAFEFPGTGTGSSGGGGGTGKAAGSSTSVSRATQNNNELKRIYNQLSSAGTYKCVHAFDHDLTLPQDAAGSSSTRITAFNCVNTVQSPVILTATADRRIHLLDAAVGRIAYSIGGADGLSTFPHERAAHCLALPPGPSVHTSAGVPISLYTVFASAAVDNMIALYDIRTPQYCTARYTGHKNTRDPIQIAFSPCLRYLATGSEDRSVRILDIRAGLTEIAKIHNIHRDTVSDVVYNPLFPQMCSSSYDGTVKFYN